MPPVFRMFDPLSDRPRPLSAQDIDHHVLGLGSHSPSPWLVSVLGFRGLGVQGLERTI